MSDAPLPIDRKMRQFAKTLDDADRFIDAATIVCDESKRLFGVACVVMLHRSSGSPSVAVDNIAAITDRHRLACVSLQAWTGDPAFRALRKQLGPVGTERLNVGAFIGLSSAELQNIALPIIEPGGLLGSLGYGRRAPLSSTLERDLCVIASYLSVWCARRGVSAVADAPTHERLGSRAQEVALLAARGLTNAEIHDALDISINTVKGRLKEVFVRLGVSNRTELANVLQRTAPYDDVSTGVTRRGSVTITRAAVTPGAVSKPVW